MRITSLSIPERDMRRDELPLVLDAQKRVHAAIRARGSTERQQGHYGGGSWDDLAVNKRQHSRNGGAKSSGLFATHRSTISVGKNSAALISSHGKANGPSPSPPYTTTNSCPVFSDAGRFPI